MKLNGSQYTLQGINPLHLCAKYGTPLYVYDAETIENQYNILRGVFSDVKNLRINFAIKALSNQSILKLMHRFGSCVDTVSIEEVKLCLKAGFSPSEIGYTPSGVTWEEIEEAVGLKVKIHVDSVPLLRRFGRKYGDTYPVGIRLNPPRATSLARSQRWTRLSQSCGLYSAAMGWCFGAF